MQEIPAEDPEFSPMGLSSFADDEEHISLDGLRAPYKAQTEIPLPSPTVRLGDLETVFNTTDPPDKTLTDIAVPEPPIEDRENTLVKTSSPSDQLPDQHPDELFASAPIQHLVRMKKGTRRKKLTPIISSLTKSISRNYYST